MALLVGIAAQAGLPIDLHLDETLDPSSLTVATVADEVERQGIGGRSVASHCVSLGQQESTVAREIAKSLAAAGISVVTLPRTNLFLQGRALETRLPRALTAVKVLRDAGVNVGAKKNEQLVTGSKRESWMLTQPASIVFVCASARCATSSPVLVRQALLRTGASAEASIPRPHAASCSSARARRPQKGRARAVQHRPSL